jgi:hypothetical protein
VSRPQVANVRWVPCHQGMARPQVADVRWVPCHYGITRPQVADGGDGLQIWRVAANISNKQPRTTYRGWFSSLEVNLIASLSIRRCPSKFINVTMWEHFTFGRFLDVPKFTTLAPLP